MADSPAGFSQGVRRSVGGLATILGPLWAGGLTENMYIMMGVMMALLVLLMVFLISSLSRTPSLFSDYGILPHIKCLFRRKLGFFLFNGIFKLCYSGHPFQILLMEK